MIIPRQKPERRVDKLIIGGGLAGAMAAVRLASAGRDGVPLETEPATHHQVC